MTVYVFFKDALEKSDGYIVVLTKKGKGKNRVG
jgi:hypothetical protein